METKIPTKKTQICEPFIVDRIFAPFEVYSRRVRYLKLDKEGEERALLALADLGKQTTESDYWEAWDEMLTITARACCIQIQGAI